MKTLLFVVGALCLSAQTWNCITISGGVPQMTPPTSSICNGYVYYFSQNATYSVSAWNAHLAQNVYGPTPVTVSGNGACHDPAATNPQQDNQSFPKFNPNVTSQGSTCTWYVLVTSYNNVSGSLYATSSPQGVTSNIPCGPCPCSPSDCTNTFAKSACGCICPAAALRESPHAAIVSAY